MPDRVLLSVDQVRQQLGGISRTTVYKLIDSGDLRRVKIGTRTMIPSDSIAAFLVRQRHGVEQPYDKPLPMCCSCPVHCPK